MAKVGRPKKEDAKKKVLSVRLSPDTYKRLTAYALLHNKTLTEVALKGLEEYLSRQE